MIPAAGATALQTALGVMSDQGIVEEPMFELEARLVALWPYPDEADYASNELRPLELSIDEAELLLRALRLTEALSTDFDWYAMVIDTVRFVGDQLLALWPTSDWLAFHDRQDTF